MSGSPTVPYRTVLPLDRGGRFEVWRIEPIADGRTVARRELVPVPAELAGPPLAVKCLPPDADDAAGLGETLRREARLQRRVAHPGIAAVALVEIDGRPAVVSPLAWGSLDALPPGIGTWSTRAAAEALRRLADALAALHAAGVVHGDVAPTNVLLLEDDWSAPPTIALTDFGGATEPGGPGPGCGTPGAVAPEVVAGDGPGAAADVYGLGRVGHALLAATDPGEATAERSALEAWCDGLVDPDPRNRPAAAVAAATVPLAPRVRTVEFQRRPHPPEQAVPARSRIARAVRVRIATVALVAVTIAASLVASAGGPHHTNCPRSGTPGWLRPGAPRPFDVLGTGCAQQVTWSGTVLTVRAARSDGGVRRYRLGRPGDELALARWGCTGRPRPAIYRPSLGEVLAYPELPTHAGAGGATSPTRHFGQAVDGDAHLVRDAHGCAHLVVGVRVLRPRSDR